MASTSTIFSGTSRFSADFSSVIDRTVAIASLPIKLLQQQKTKLDDQTTALTSLNSKLSTLQSALAPIQNAFGSSSFTTSISDASAAALTASDTATTGSWTVDVKDLGSTTSYVVTGFPPVADPSQAGYITGGTQTLLLDIDPTDGLNNPEVITLSPAGTSLSAVVDNINKTAGSRVQAAMVNIGTNTSPQYQLSLQSRTLGPIDITFTDGARSSTNLAAKRGSLAQYSVNGADISTDSRNITLAPGVTLDLKSKTTSPVIVNVKESTSSLSSALRSFATAYNSVLTELNKHRGNKNAALSGNSIINATSAAMRRLVTTTASSAGFNSLSDLGMGFQRDGSLYIDTAIFDKATAGNLKSVKTFLGTTDGSGLLKNISGVLNGLTMMDTGIVSSAIATTQAAAKTQDQHISDQQDRVDRLEESLRTRMAAADAAVAMLEQNATYMNNMFSAMRANTSGQ